MKKWKIGVLLVALAVACGMPVSANAATQSQRESCKKKILEILYTGDTEQKSISWYRITKDDFNKLFDEIRHGDGAEIYGGYYPSTNISYTYKVNSGYVQTIWLTGANEDALLRYEQMVPVIDSIVAGIEEDMTDVDKVIYLHDAIVDSVAYVRTNDAMFTASGALVDKKAVCSGYAKALNVLLRRVGLETSYVSGTSLDHGWSYVKLDGQWYHVDPTWDDTRSPVAGKVSRANLLRNDKEFSKNHGVWEVLIVDEDSKSSKYEDWLVHDIVGEMRFENGRWYYLDTKNRTVAAIDAVNNYKETLFEYSCLGSVSLVDVIEDQIILNVNGNEISQTAEQWKIVSEEAKEEVQITPEGGAILPLDFSSLAYWRTGHYDATYGAYCLNRTRICLNDLMENVQEQYRVSIGNNDYKVAIREYNARKKIIGSAELGDGEVYIPSEGTMYLGISVFNSVQSKGITFETYESLFANGFTVGFNLSTEENIPENGEDDVPGSNIEDVPEIEIENMPEIEIEDAPENKTEDVPEEETLLSLDFSDITLWKTGHYDATYGAYCLNRARICLNDLIEAVQGQYVVRIGDENYKVAIREYNARKRIIGSAELGDGEIYVASEEAVYIGISVFNCVQPKGIDFATYENMFANGFEVGLRACAVE